MLLAVQAALSAERSVEQLGFGGPGQSDVNNMNIATMFTSSEHEPMSLFQRFLKIDIDVGPIHPHSSTRNHKAHPRLGRPVSKSFSKSRFFKRTLAAARGEASAEQRSCSICLEDDLKEELRLGNSAGFCD